MSMIKFILVGIMHGMFVLFLLTNILAECSIINLRVNNNQGLDTEHCLQFNSTIPCKTMSYAYNSVIHNSSNYTELNIEIVGNFKLNQTFFINKLSKNIRTLKFFSQTNTIIEPANRKEILHLVIGSNAYGLNYKIVFEGIQWHRFSLKQPSVLELWRTELVVDSCSFISNKCSAINSLDASLVIVNSYFYNNTGSAVFKGLFRDVSSFPLGINSAGGAVGILFQTTSQSFVTIVNNTFVQNRAVSISSKYILDKNKKLQCTSKYGGALLLQFEGQSTESRILIDSNVFDANEASIGGGLIMTFHDQSRNNTITISNIKFIRNIASVTGGAFAFITWDLSTGNRIEFENSLVAYNGAPVGGGGKVLLQSCSYFSPSSPSIQYITFRNITFKQNKAACSSGLHLIFNLISHELHSGEKPIIPILFTNVTFARHSPTHSPSIGPSAYSGVLLSNRVDMIFQGDNYFYNNSLESSMYLSNTEFHLDGTLLFRNNYAQTSGGGITLTDVSHLYLYPGCRLLFHGNTAQVQGGAMFVQTVGFPDMVYKYNPSCFLQYSEQQVSPSKWNVTVEFIKNGAGLKGAAIFANTITSCIWKEDPPYYDFQKALRWSDRFVYRENYLTGNSLYLSENGNTDIATDTTHFRVNLPKDRPVEVYPGQKLEFEMSGYDELSHTVYSVPIASSHSLVDNRTLGNSNITLTRNYYILKPEGRMQTLQYSTSREFYEQLKSSGGTYVESVQFSDSYSSFLSNTSFKIKPVKCRPGFVFQDGTCVCDSSPHNNIIRCEEKLVFVQPNFWATIGKNGNLITSQCPPYYCQCRYNKTKDGCAFDMRNPDLQCAPGRKGVLCGQCEQGKGVNFMTSKCVKCNGFHWSIVLLSVIGVTLALTAVFILVFAPRFSTHMRGILFFVQMLPYVVNPSETLPKIVLTTTSWMDLGGANNIPASGCLIENFNNLDAVMLGYLYPVIIAVVILILYFAHTMCITDFRWPAPFRSLWILMFVSYKFLAETSLLLLFCVQVDGEYKYFFNGNVTCYQKVHLIMTVVAGVVILLLVLPPPILVVFISYGYFVVGPCISDPLVQGLRRHVRWWWSFDFIRRLVFISIYVFVPDWQLKQMGLTISCVLVLVFHIHMQPYRNRQANAGETFLLTILTLLTTIKESSSKNQVQDYILNACLVTGTSYCFIVTIYLWLTYAVKFARLHFGCGRYEEPSDSNEDDRYKESLLRRLPKLLPGSKRKELTIRPTDFPTLRPGLHDSASSPLIRTKPTEVVKGYDSLSR